MSTTIISTALSIDDRGNLWGINARHIEGILQRLIYTDVQQNLEGTVSGGAMGNDGNNGSSSMANWRFRYTPWISHRCPPWFRYAMLSPDDVQGLTTMGTGIHSDVHRTRAVRIQLSERYACQGLRHRLHQQAEYLSSLFVDSKKNLWLGNWPTSPLGEDRFKNKFNYNMSMIFHLFHKSVTALCADNSGGVWIATARDGFYTVNKSTGNVEDVSAPSSARATFIMRYFIDSKGYIWMMTSGGKVFCCTVSGGNLILKKSYSMPSFPFAMTEMTNGDIFMTGYDQCIYMLSNGDNEFRRTPLAKIVSASLPVSSMRATSCYWHHSIRTSESSTPRRSRQWQWSFQKIRTPQK